MAKFPYSRSRFACDHEQVRGAGSGEAIGRGRIVAALAGLDVYGLDEEPVARSAPGGGVAQSQAPVQTGPAGKSSDLQPALPRREGYKPLSEKKKKQIRTRADQLDRRKSWTAGVRKNLVWSCARGLPSIGWRIYRAVHRDSSAPAAADQWRLIQPQKMSISISSEIP